MTNDKLVIAFLLEGARKICEIINNEKKINATIRPGGWGGGGGGGGGHDAFVFEYLFKY